MLIPGGCTLWARQTLDSDIFKNKPDKWFKIWFYIVNKANHRDNKEFKRGEAFLKYEWIVEATGATKSQIDHFIRWSKVGRMLATRKATRGLFISVLKYEQFQNIENYKSDSKSDLKAKQKRNRSDTINKNDNNDKNIVDSPNGSPTVTNNFMYEELNDGEVTYDSEDNPKKKDTFGEYPARVSVEYCKLTGNNRASAQLKAAKELMKLALKNYPKDTREQHFEEIVSRMKIAKIHYENLPNPITEWSLGKIVEKWDKILSEWYQENLKLKK